MAARTSTPSLQQQEKTRAAIQTSQLINRLQDFALHQNDVVIDKDRLKAIEVLLRKSLPDLSSISLTGDPDNPIPLVHRIERQIVRPDEGEPSSGT